MLFRSVLKANETGSVSLSDSYSPSQTLLTLVNREDCTPPRFGGGPASNEGMEDRELEREGDEKKESEKIRLADG